MALLSKFVSSPILVVYIILILIGTGCSNNEEPTIESKLVTATWNGWYTHDNLTSGIVFSIRFENDKTAQWYELNRENNGTWTMQDNQVQLNFNGEVLTGIFEGDSLKNVTSNSGKNIYDLKASGKFPSVDELSGTTWKGETQLGQQVDIGFNSIDVDLSLNLKNFFTERVQYESYGNGIILSDELTHEPHMYIVFQQGNLMGSGFSITYPSYLFIAKKSQ